MMVNGFMNKNFVHQTNIKRIDYFVKEMVNYLFADFWKNLASPIYRSSKIIKIESNNFLQNSFPANNAYLGESP